jgi:hypothetical protein
MDVARLPATELDRNGSAPALRAMPAPSEDELRQRSLRLAGPARRHRFSGPTLAALATAAGIGALALGASAFVAEVRSADEAPAVAVPSALAAERAVALLSRPGTQRLPLTGSEGRIVLAVGVGGRGVLVLDALDPAPTGESYQAWLIGPDGKVAGSAAVFAGDETVVPLSQRVVPGAGIGVTLERAGGVPAPTRRLTLVARRP